MKKLSVIFLLTFCIFLLFVCECLALNPFVTTVYTADPSAHVFEGRVYVYTSHDRDNPDWFNMEDYHVFSSSGDLKEWVDHGVILHLLDVPWAKNVCGLQIVPIKTVPIISIFLHLSLQK